MIYKTKRDVTAIYHDNKVIVAVYQGGNLVWQAIKSCFGNGFWINEKPWINTDAWKNEV